MKSDSKMVIVGIGGTGADVLKSVCQRLQTASDNLVNASIASVSTLLDSGQEDAASSRSLVKQSENIRDQVRLIGIPEVNRIFQEWQKRFPETDRLIMQRVQSHKVKSTWNRPRFSLTHELGHWHLSKESWRLLQVTDNIREQTSQLEERMHAILSHAEFSEPDIYQKASVQHLFKSLEVFREQLDIFQQAVRWLSVVHMPLYVAWAWLQTTSKDFTGFLRNLGSFIDKILYLSGIHLTQFCVNLLPPYLGAELQALYEERTKQEASNLNILISVVFAFLDMQVALLIMDLDDSSNDGLVLAM